MVVPLPHWLTLFLSTRIMIFHFFFPNLGTSHVVYPTLLFPYYHLFPLFVRVRVCVCQNRKNGTSIQS